MPHRFLFIIIIIIIIIITITIIIINTIITSDAGMKVNYNYFTLYKGSS